MYLIQFSKNVVIVSCKATDPNKQSILMKLDRLVVHYQCMYVNEYNINVKGEITGFTYFNWVIVSCIKQLDRYWWNLTQL